MDSDRRPLVSVIVPHYNDAERLSLCLNRLSRQTLAEPYEIIVADNGSALSDAQLDAVIAQRARLVRVFERGAGPARNGGVKLARGRILAFTDSDCLPELEWLKAGVHATSSYDLVGGQMLVLLEDPTKMSGAEAFEKTFAFNNKRYVTKKGFTVTANLFCLRETFTHVGPFKTEVSEDVEWCQRALGLGYSIGYSEEAIVYHPARRNWNELLVKWRRINKEAFMLKKQSGSGLAKYLIFNLCLPASVVIDLPKVFINNNGMSFYKKLEVLSTLFRLRTWRSIDTFKLLFQSTFHAST